MAEATLGPAGGFAMMPNKAMHWFPCKSKDGSNHTDRIVTSAYWKDTAIFVVEHRFDKPPMA
jgi:hypothetical protein